ncbi:hypothetical protein CWI84_01140 [Idiomarina tyrosinivorans]|uniref:KOW domain-containing protein n=1 Tax=Idiomarina tyrosinivorans TaxID=1445662 RepID=A0A432ZU80_9GAMM|nr:DUF3912 family protein [Idiomarina tyrosinivorans]RUO81392.1 hypothetical protein CWI84_01140 [Idiomarina tyrosinivorans]
MTGPTFSYNNPRIQGQTVFIKRGQHQGKLGIVSKIIDNEEYVVSQGDFGKDEVSFKREEFLVYRFRKIKVPIDRVTGRTPEVL